MGGCASLQYFFDEKKRNQVIPPLGEGQYSMNSDESSGSVVIKRYVLQQGESEGEVTRSYAQLMNIWEELCHSPHAMLFTAHPELLFSNRAAVMCTGEFMPGEIVGKYRVLSALPIGTVGRNFLVTLNELNSGKLSMHSSPNINLKLDNKLVFKVVTFVTRMDQARFVLEDNKVLINLHHENILPCVDVLDDAKHENLIVVSPYLEGDTCESLAGKIENEEKLSKIFHEIAIALRILHSHKIYHHNLKLSNVFIKSNGSPCITDSGFWRIFANQTPESLVFNGELACIPPEIFDNNGISLSEVGKVDIWGFGLFMYRLAYGFDPFDIEGKTFEEVRECVLHKKIEFPSKHWSIASELEGIIHWCLERDALKRPNIIRLLRHSFFRHCMTQSIGSGGCGGLTSSVMNGFSIPFNSMNLSISNVGGFTTRSQWRNGFLISATLGKGRFCETFLVHLRRKPENSFAVKVMRNSVLKKISTSRDSGKICKALVISREIRHPNILQLQEIVDGKDGCFVCQAYIESEFLNKSFPPIINRDEPTRTVRRMLVDVLKGLYVLHLNNVTHLNLTPSNIYYKHGNGFVISDFGPVFCSRVEAISGGEFETPLYNCPPWVLTDLKTPKSETHHYIDTFCVGLLAASTLPSILNEVWDSFCKLNSKPLIIEDIITKVKNDVDVLSQPLVDFIIKTLTTKTTSIELLRDSYLVDLVNTTEVYAIKPMILSSNSIKNSVREKFSSRDESRLLDILGQDPMMESVFIGTSCMIDSTTEDESRPSITCSIDQDAITRLPFENKIICGLCHVELPIVIFKCNLCITYVRCGKCSLNDNHAKGHELKPFLIHTIEHNEGGKQEGILVSPASIQKTHPLEELEMQANLPSGTLTKSIQSQTSVTERPLARLKKQKGNLNSNNSNNNNKKKVLPKASEVDDLSWEEEIKNCREKRIPELLLYRFDLTSIPKEVFDPPLIHVVSFDLSYNKLKTIPHEISFLIYLRSLVIANNELSELPDSLGNLNLLERLDVSHNNLRELPQTFVFLHQLSTIAMDYNDFSEIPEILIELIVATSTIPLLSVIYLAENPRITQFPNVESLSLFPTLKLALDNEPNVYKTYINQNLEVNLPHVSMMWNKIYPDRIVPHVYCGSLRSAQSQFVYNKLEILNLLTMGRDLVPTPPENGKHLTINVDDIEGADIQRTFAEAVEFIHQSVDSKKGCLVHCFAGMSRSATTVIAYLMIKQNMRLDEAYCITKRGRPAIYPNKSFFEQLVRLDAKLFPQQRELNMASMEREKVPTA